MISYVDHIFHLKNIWFETNPESRLDMNLMSYITSSTRKTCIETNNIECSILSLFLCYSYNIHCFSSYSQYVIIIIICWQAAPCPDKDMWVFPFCPFQHICHYVPLIAFHFCATDLFIDCQTAFIYHICYRSGLSDYNAQLRCMSYSVKKIQQSWLIIEDMS